MHRTTWHVWYREEAEKFNIWQAWLNLENMYGSPTPEEAVTRVFQKALPYCNAKKLYQALLDILERTDKVSGHCGALLLVLLSATDVLMSLCSNYLCWPETTMTLCIAFSCTCDDTPMTRGVGSHASSTEI